MKPIESTDGRTAAVVKKPTKTTLAVKPNPSVHGNPITISGSVKAASVT